MKADSVPVVPSAPSEPSRSGGGLARKGRGAVSNLPGRFETRSYAAEGDGWFDGDEGVAPLPTVVFEERASSLINHNRSPDIFFDRSINPYRGCEHGCIYCYARPNHAYVGLSPGLDFESRLFAKVNAPELLRRELAQRRYQPAVVHIGASTDPYQPIERRYRLTRQCLEILADHRHPVSVITKSSLIERDTEVLADLAKDALVWACVSVTTLDVSLSQILEPRAASPERRLRTVRHLADAGIPVAVSISPIIPFINEPEIERLLEASKEAGAIGASYIPVRLPWEVAPLFEQWLFTHFPDRAERVLARIADMRGGGRNDPRFGHRMRGEGVWADLLHQRFSRAAKQFGLSRQHPALDVSRFRVPGSSAMAQQELF